MTVKTIIGQAARGEEFFPRHKLIGKLTDNITKGNHILLSAPRRVGKTSVMYYLLDNPPENFLIEYLITQSVNNENDYYKRIYKKVVEIVSKANALWKQTTQLIKSKKITAISLEGVTIEDIKIDYYQELISLLKSLDLGDKRLIIMIDEFSETLENIITDEGEREAIHFLESNRDFRQLPEFKNKVQFIYTGSIGIENIVAKLNKINTINDLYPFKIPPFTKLEAMKLISSLIEESDIIIEKKTTEYLVAKIDWLIPYFLQILVDEIDKIDWDPNTDSKRVVIESIIDQAFKNSIDNRIYFEHWLTRLRITYKGDEYKFAMMLLNYTSENPVIHSNDILDLSVKFNIQNSYKEILDSLCYDGYINNLTNVKEYRFNSPLLKLWWFNKVVN
ncbi:MAG: hypothetical protein K8S16_10360 [Bacteroidales bacterium]|nr:hypothetical protein [Bacteroidales bacterium]